MFVLQKDGGIIKRDAQEGKSVYRSRQKESSFDESKQIFQEQKMIKNTQSNSSSGYDLTFWIFVGVSQLAGLAVVVLVAYWCVLYNGFAWESDAKLQFNYHPLLMILGLIFCYGDAVLIYRIFHFLPKWILKWIHAALHLSAIVMSSVGLAAVFENHRRLGFADMYSLHSWVGITTFGLFCVQYIVSFIAFLFPGLPQSMRAIMMPFHQFFGVGIFILAVASALMGITEKLVYGGDYYVLPQKAVVGNCLGLCIVVFAFLVVFLSTHHKYKRSPLPSD